MPWWSTLVIRGRIQAYDRRGLRRTRCAHYFDRVFIVIRDDPALLSRSIDVLGTARPPHGELIVCEQRGAAHRRVMVESMERELPDLPIRRGWDWDERRAARTADTGRPMTSPASKRSYTCERRSLGAPASLVDRRVSGTVPVSRWPQIPTEEREVAEIIAALVHRSRHGEPASVLHEERLGDDVAAAIDRAIERHSQAVCRSQWSRSSARNPRYRATMQRNAVILGSHLYPLSLLIYGAELENITCLGHDHWLVSTVGRKLSLIGGSPFSSDEEVLEFFRGVVRLRA